MQTHEFPGLEGMKKRSVIWYDATGQYPEQLFEVDRDDYLRDKLKEYEHQMELQSAEKNQ